VRRASDAAWRSETSNRAGGTPFMPQDNPFEAQGKTAVGKCGLGAKSMRSLGRWRRSLKWVRELGRSVADGSAVPSIAFGHGMPCPY
jgi:hypothetical protein